MSFIDKLKEWWNKPSLEDEFCKEWNDMRKAMQEKLKSYESMSERQLLIEIAKNTLKEVE